MKQGTGRVVLSASQGNVEAIADGALGGGHGLFTYYLMEALKRSHGLEPIGTMFSNVQQQVSARARSLRATQVPAMAQSDEGDQIVIGVAPAAGSSPTGG
jgi:hypothetical protein